MDYVFYYTNDSTSTYEATGVAGNGERPVIYVNGKKPRTEKRILHPISSWQYKSDWKYEADKWWERYA